MVLVTTEEFVSVLGGIAVRTFVYGGREEAWEAVFGFLREEKLVLGLLRGVWGSFSWFLDVARRRGLNQYLFTPVDPLEFGFAGLAGVSPAGLVAAKNTLAGYSMSQRALFSVEVSKSVDRRSLLRSPLKSIMVYRPAPVLLNEETCASWKYCNNCVVACPFGALVGKPPSVNLDACTGCGLCAGACPFGLLMPPRVNVEAFEKFLDALQARSNGRPAYVVVACRSGLPDLARVLEGESLEGLEPAFFVDVDCPGWGTQFHALAAAGKGFHTIVYCPHGTVESCGAGDRVERLLAEMDGLPVHPQIVSDPRRLLDLLGEPPKARNIVGNELLTGNRSLAYKILHKYGVGEAEYSTPIVGYPLVDESKCILCEACSSMCPFQALKLEKTPESTRLVFEPYRCTACGVCEVACAYDALKLKYLFRRESLPGTVLVEDEVARCRRCGRPIGSVRHLRMLEEKLRASGVDEWVIEQLWLCQECKVRALLERRMRERGN